MKQILNREKRKLAAILALLLVINALPHMEMEPVQAADTDFHKILVSVKTDEKEGYQGAIITVSGSNGDTVSGNNEGGTVSGGNAEVPHGDSVTLTPKPD